MFAPESVQSVCYTTLSNVGSVAHSFPLLGGAGSPEQPILGQRGLQAHTFPLSFQHFSSHFCRNYLISLITDMGTHHFPFGNYLNFAFHTFLSKIPINHTDTCFLFCKAIHQSLPTLYNNPLFTPNIYKQQTCVLTFHTFTLFVFKIEC